MKRGEEREKGISPFCTPWGHEKLTETGIVERRFNNFHVKKERGGNFKSSEILTKEGELLTGKGADLFAGGVERVHLARRGDLRLLGKGERRDHFPQNKIHVAKARSSRGLSRRGERKGTPTLEGVNLQSRGQCIS